MDVAILGCGYVGVELGRRLSSAGHDVVGVRRSTEGIERISAAGFEGVRADVTEAGSLEAVPDVDAVVYSVSAGGRGAEPARRAYLEGQSTAAEAFGRRSSPPDRWIYTSSTGVYGDHGGDIVDEETPLEPESERGRILVEAESIATDLGIDGTVVRLGGLYGPGRYRIDRYLEGPVTERHVNLIHRDDAAGVVAYLLVEDLARGEVVLGVDDEPARRPDLAAWLARQCDVPVPATTSIERRLEGVDDEARRRRIRSDKRCSNAKIRGMGYEFEYPTYREGYAEAVERRGSSAP